MEVRQLSFSAGCFSARSFSTDSTSTGGGEPDALRDDAEVPAPIGDPAPLASFVVGAAVAAAGFTAGWFDGKILLRICPNTLIVASVLRQTHTLSRRTAGVSRTREAQRVGRPLQLDGRGESMQEVVTVWCGIPSDTRSTPCRYCRPCRALDRRLRSSIPLFRGRPALP